MKTITIEWRHYAKKGATCDRCAATGRSVKEVVADFTGELASRGVKVVFLETVLPEEQMAESNMILFNGIPLEDILRDTTAAENACPSCSCLTGIETSCRTIEQGGTIYEEIPAEIIRRAALLVAGLS